MTDQQKKPQADEDRARGNISSTYRQPRILLLSGYDAVSHRRWREQLIDMLDDYYWHTLALPPRFFRWRIRGNPLSWLNEPALGERWDLVIATSMVDLTSVRSFHPHLAQTPCILYMHENQFAFPISSKQRSSAEPQVVNLYSAISADCVIFNSFWNRDSFLNGAQSLLMNMPDRVPDGLTDFLKEKSIVIPVPIENHLFFETPHLKKRSTRNQLWKNNCVINNDGTPTNDPKTEECDSENNTPPIKLVWASRWEYDKGPEHLLELLRELDKEKVDCRVAILGENFRNAPKEFATIKDEFPHLLDQFGYVDSRERYFDWLKSGDVVISTALHEFQGIAILEAVACGCIPLLPKRLSYCELFDTKYLFPSLPHDPKAEAQGAVDLLKGLIPKIVRGTIKTPDVSKFSVSELQPKYKEIIDEQLSTNF